MSGKTKLYPHQKKALLKMVDKATRGECDPGRRSPNTGAGFLAMGVGTGKSVVISCLPYVLAPYMQGRQVLIVVDNCTLRARILQDFPTDARHCPIYDKWPLYSLGILPPGVPPPQIAELRAEDWKSYAFSLDKADLLVVNRQFLLNLVNRGDIDPANIGLVIVDEGHHAAASSYRTIFSYLSNSMLVFLSGSRFRSDSKPLPYIRYDVVEDENENGFPVMRYAPVADFEFTLQNAWKLNPPPIKRLTYKEATSLALLIEEDGVEVEYTPEAFFAKASDDREWFRHILLADKFCLPVLEQAVSILELKRRTGQPHKMIVRSLNILHAHRLFKLLDNFPMLTGRVGLVHSDKEGFDLAGRPTETYNKFFSGELICLVHCSMVGEGFNDEWASVSVPLCVMRSLPVAEQEFGRVIRRVPGRPPGKFPDLAHENWGVVVTHEALAIREIFEKFIAGVKLAPLSGYSDSESDWSEPVVEKPQVVKEYEAGDTTLTLSNTKQLEAGDLIILNVPVEREVATVPKFDLIEELRATGNLSLFNNSDAINELADTTTSTSKEEESLTTSFHTPQQLQLPLFEQEQGTASAKPEPEREPSITDRAVEMIANHLHSLRETRTVTVRVEAVLNDNTVEITPIWSDLPAGADIVKKPVRKELREIQANFIDHIGLDWCVLHEGEFIKFSDYRRRVVLRRHNLDVDKEGEIVTEQGMRLRNVMPSSAYQFFLKGLESEIEQADIEIPHPAVPCRPDEIKKSLQEKYGQRIRACIFDLLDSTWLIPDGRTGRSLIVNPLKCVEPLMSHENDDGLLVSFNYQNNVQLLHKVVFAHIKETTGKKWGMHETESDYAAAEKIAREFISLFKRELEQRRANDKIVNLHPQRRRLSTKWEEWKSQYEQQQSQTSSDDFKTTNFSIIVDNESDSYSLHPLMECPTAIADQILLTCGITRESGAAVKLDKSVLTALRQFYSLIKRNPQGSVVNCSISQSELLTYIVNLGKQLQTHEILVHAR